MEKETQFTGQAKFPVAQMSQEGHPQWLYGVQNLEKKAQS